MAFLSSQKRQFLRLPTADADFDKSDRFAFIGIVEVLSRPSAFKRQFLRLPIADSSFDKDDRFAILGVIRTLTSTLTSAQKKQLLRLPVVDASFTTSDKFAFFGLMEPSGGLATEVLFERFEVTWSLDPTWSVTEKPETNTGNIFVEIGGFVFALAGINIDPPVAKPGNPGTEIVNAVATLNVTRYEIDDRTGAKAYPGTFVSDYTGYMTNKRSRDFRSGQEHTRGREDNFKGSVRPEQTDVFITADIKAEDL